MLGLCLYRLGSWMIKKSHSLARKKSALERLAEYTGLDLEEVSQWSEDLRTLFDGILGGQECT